jgi:hypothetical protein
MMPTYCHIDSTDVIENDYSIFYCRVTRSQEQMLLLHMFYRCAIKHPIFSEQIRQSLISTQNTVHRKTHEFDNSSLSPTTADWFQLLLYFSCDVRHCLRNPKISNSIN